MLTAWVRICLLQEDKARLPKNTTSLQKFLEYWLSYIEKRRLHLPSTKASNLSIFQSRDEFKSQLFFCLNFTCLPHLYDVIAKVKLNVLKPCYSYQYCFIYKCNTHLWHLPIIPCNCDVLKIF